MTAAHIQAKTINKTILSCILIAGTWKALQIGRNMEILYSDFVASAGVSSVTEMDGNVAFLED